ncbi:unnamed protein product [Penicillium salamii]|uniref:Enoyl reductase (ER) domain-containing protein n=1 Tax=Penicillium salamii TaxID=1612424 RepID=A0A9W4JSA9_9EURO|nr:unnamed protein product [Penicillium salamii]CAG8403862.1 unnamed protein product [Penicillium salamii]CAG8409095.1 unnamed protein product [Penicillium salamii]CAG8411524.1 unnamed protein product [Penicillium salamii]
MKQWILEGIRGAESLQLKDVPDPEPGDYEVLVKFRTASLNFRDIMISKGEYYSKTKDGVVPGSDAAGEIVKVGPKVTRFTIGKRTSPIFHLTHLYGPVNVEDNHYQLGGTHDACVEFPSNLDYREAATLPCAALTAWNALYGGPRVLKPGEVVLTQGTGGVSIFALQFAKIGGAHVISTTSSETKSRTLRTHGADAVINYAEDSEWGQTAKLLSPKQKGVDFVVEIANTMAQSSRAVAIDGQIATIGRRAGSGNAGNGSHSTVLATVRRILVGSRELQEGMNAAIEVNNLKPEIDKRSFNFDDLPKAYTFFEKGSHCGKVVVDYN